MKKNGLKEMKLKNKNLLISIIMGKENISRTELVIETGLAASTVSSLMAELIDDGIIIEIGETASTGGRKRMVLSINPNKGDIAVVQVGRNGAKLFIFDMCLNQLEGIDLSNSFISGNDLLVSITSRLVSHLRAEPKRKLSGIGLLFQKDMRVSDFNVMYSTSLSSASISLAEALFTQFRVKVTEEYSVDYSMTDALEERTKEAGNSAHILLGQNVLASVSLNGTAIALKEGYYSDITPMLKSTTVDLQGFDYADDLVINTEKSNILLSKLFGIIMLLSGIFPLEKVMLSGISEKNSDIVKNKYDKIKSLNNEIQLPKLDLIKNLKYDMADIVAQNLRQSLIYY